MERSAEDDAQVEAMIAALVGAPPTSLRALDLAVGPLRLDPREVDDAAWTGGAVQREDVSLSVLAVSAVCRATGGRPGADDLSLTAFRVLFSSGDRACAAMLERRYGRPRVLSEGTLLVRGYGPFYLVERVAPLCDLAWCETPPACAVRVWHPRDPRAFRAFLELLPAAVSELRTIEDADLFRHGLPERTGVRTVPRTLASVWTLVLSPPVEVRALREVWTWPEPWAVSGDLYQTSWDVRLQAGAVDEQFGHAMVPTTYPMFGPWTVRARLVDRPPGPLPEVTSGPSPAYDLGRYEGYVATLDFAASWLEARPERTHADDPLADDRIDLDLGPMDEAPEPLPVLPPLAHPMGERSSRVPSG